MLFFFLEKKGTPHSLLRRLTWSDLETVYSNCLFGDERMSWRLFGKGLSKSLFASAAQLLQMAANTGTAFGRRVPVDEDSKISTQEYLAS